MTTYLLDADVFIRAKNQHYGFDLCPGFWTWLDRQHAARKVFSIQQVYYEILDGKDDLSNWAKQRKAMFLKPNQSTTTSLRQVSTWAKSTGYRQSAVTAFMKKADFYLVAQAHALGHTVVTYERPAPQAVKSIKIPDACNALAVNWMAPHEMLRAEGAVFDLHHQP